MAREKEKKQRKRKVDIPEGIRDYYVEYSLDKKMGTREIRKRLMQIQGEYRSRMANGSLNDPEITERLQEGFNGIAAAIKVFKTEERRKEYDLQLEAAYEANMIDLAAQKLAQDLYDEIMNLFLKGNYKGAARKCLNALNNNVRDYRLYLLLAQSYYAMQNVDESLKTVETGLQVHPDNLDLLKAGARFSNEGKADYDKAQRYVNRMMEIDPESPQAVSEQSYLYLSTGKEDLAYQTIDQYVEKHPDDQKFRRDCAYDLVGHSYSYYTKQPDQEAYVIASQEDYQKCLDTCNKAASLYIDENVQTALDNAAYFGKVEFNDENTPNIRWLVIGGALYLIAGLIALVTVSGEIMTTILVSLTCLALAGLLFFSAFRLWQVSHRPYWQINKFIMTGKREKGERLYYWIGVIFAGYLRVGFKLGIEIFKWGLRLCFPF